MQIDPVTSRTDLQPVYEHFDPKSPAPGRSTPVIASQDTVTLSLAAHAGNQSGYLARPENPFLAMFGEAYTAKGIDLTKLETVLPNKLEALSQKVTSLLAQEGIDTSVPFTLDYDASSPYGMIVVQGSHPQKDQIDALFQDLELQNQYKQIMGLLQLIEQGKLAAAHQKAQNESATTGDNSTTDYWLAFTTRRSSNPHAEPASGDRFEKMGEYFTHLAQQVRNTTQVHYENGVLTPAVVGLADRLLASSPF